MLSSPARRTEPENHSLLPYDGKCLFVLCI